MARTVSPYSAKEQSGALTYLKWSQTQWRSIWSPRLLSDRSQCWARTYLPALTVVFFTEPTEELETSATTNRIWHDTRSEQIPRQSRRQWNIFFTGKMLFHISVLPVPTQADSDGPQSRHFQILGNNFFLGKQWDQHQKEVKSHSRKLYEILHQMKGKIRRHKNCVIRTGTGKWKIV